MLLSQDKAFYTKLLTLIHAVTGIRLPFSQWFIGMDIIQAYSSVTHRLYFLADNV